MLKSIYPGGKSTIPGGIFFFSTTPAGKPRANASRPKRWWGGGKTPRNTVVEGMTARAAVAVMEDERLMD